MKFEDMVKFSLGFMPKKLQSLTFFIPLFLLYIISMVVAYFLFGNLMTEHDQFANMINSAFISGTIPDTTSTPQNSDLLGFSLLIMLLAWILKSYAVICVYNAAKLEYSRKEWDARGMLNKFLGILPKYIGVYIMEGIIVLLPMIPGFALVVAGFLSNSNIFLLLGFLLIILGIIPAIYIAFRLFVATVALVIEDKGIIESLKRSWFLTERNFGYVFGYVISFYIIVSIISIILRIPVLIITLIEGFFISMAPISSILGYLISFYVTTAIAVFSYMIYLSLVERKNLAITTK